ncbi:molybdenum cofactor synthesis domain-containing protein [Saccharicrinis carchari]|uniref:Molybdopterin adenylyltransferase n=1 Tax=Saccharicrinis carchari TaxID=1168039 RepID=A0A521F402_SACCC|nr:MOSC domain-containing protein [Saccharicrinis carchari]SMO90331.1 molybdenum cofactor synthesis domain-containing protein [Saccharicrinis carchari]
MQKFNVKSVNLSEKKGTIKTPSKTIVLNDTGVSGDAHSGPWHRQVSLLGIESYRKTKEASGIDLNYGDFAENITTEGLALHHSIIFDRFVCGDIELEVTQIGKKCHNGCEIKTLVGDCVMPREGIFCRVLSGGILKPGDVFEYIPRQIKVHIITLSDRAHAGIYEDKSGPFAEKTLKSFFDKNGRHYSFKRTILPDDKSQIEKVMRESRSAGFDVLVTTGGTGIGPRDHTPDIVKPLLDKEIPGIMEAIRVKYGLDKPNALLSRSIAGVMGKTLVYVLPGSVKAVNEYLSLINPTIEHSLRMLHGIDAH